MGRKVFISVLGTNPYSNCRYCKADEDFECQNPYVQIATLQYLDKKTPDSWTTDDVVLILLTEAAEKANWLPSLRTNKNTGQTIEEPGLCKRLQDLHFPAQIDTVKSLPEGDSVDDMMTIFRRVIEKLKVGDELYFDITHGFRSLPMLIMVLNNYTKFLLGTDVKWISYGKTVPPFTEGTIVDLDALVNLQGWAVGAANFIENGSVDSLIELSNAETLPILRATANNNPNVVNIRTFTRILNEAIQDLKTCRCPEVMSGEKLKRLRELRTKIDLSAIAQPFGPIIERIMDSLKDFESEQSVLNGLAAARWCADHKLYPQAITYLQETVVSIVCERHNVSLDDRKKRGMISSCYNIITDSKSEDKWKVEDKDFCKLILSDVWVRNSAALYSAMSESRNDMNHAGMNDKPSIAPKLMKKIDKHISSFEELLNTMD
jgi:CRISPR-associated DxTHG motif protein